MNTNRDLLKRLLHLFPIKIVKDFFSETGNANDVIEAISGNKPPIEIRDFVFANFHSTRQNIYLFELNKKFTRQTITDNFPLKIEKEIFVDDEYTFFCLPQTTFSVYLSNPTEKEELKFRQPVIIKIKNKSLIITYTKLEKNVQFHYPENRQAKRASESNSEDETRRAILTFLRDEYQVTVNDINKGVKHLWHIDDIDCTKIQWRNPHSISSETMDGMLTYKEKYPNEYGKIILTPLGKSIWKYLRADEYFCEGFSADPNNGEISITKFPKLPNQVNNVLAKILANN